MSTTKGTAGSTPKTKSVTATATKKAAAATANGKVSPQKAIAKEQVDEGLHFSSKRVWPD